MDQRYSPTRPGPGQPGPGPQTHPSREARGRNAALVAAPPRPWDENEAGFTVEWELPVSRRP
jgi:hypothetical protein